MLVDVLNAIIDVTSHPAVAILIVGNYWYVMSCRDIDRKGRQDNA